jgi:hypothetical protein
MAKKRSRKSAQHGRRQSRRQKARTAQKIRRGGVIPQVVTRRRRHTRQILRDKERVVRALYKRSRPKLADRRRKVPVAARVVKSGTLTAAIPRRIRERARIRPVVRIMPEKIRQKI